MNVLVVGSGGREHALAWKIKQSPLVRKVFCTPGNAGMSDVAIWFNVSVDNYPLILEMVQQKNIELVVIGPEVPLVSGLVDYLSSKSNATIFGPVKAAAMLEGSKSFMKNLLTEYLIPTAKYEEFYDYKLAVAYTREQDHPLVIKASGLAAGKCVIICNSFSESVAALKTILIDHKFGIAGTSVIVEDFLCGEELSFMALVDGQTILPLDGCQDHKHIGEGDVVPNTGGMGAYTPVPFLTPALRDRIMNEVMYPTINALRSKGITYKGLLYAGLMIDGDDIRVLEFNVRFGDPETQPLLLRMKSDIVPLLLGCINGDLSKHSIEWDSHTAVTVVLSAGGYPGKYKIGDTITGLGEAEKLGSKIFYSGVAKRDDNYVTNGGRVLSVNALGNSIKEARKKVYSSIACINYGSIYYCNDIGNRSVNGSK